MSDFRLKVFVAAAKMGSFTKASAALYVSQPAVTKHIRELETEYSVRLFERSGNRISLTPEGVKFQQYAEEILKHYERLAITMSLLNNKYQGELHLGASTTIAQYLLPQYLADFSSLYPDVSLTLLNGNSIDIEQALINKDIDLGLVEGNARQMGLRYTPLMRDELVAVVSTHSKLAIYDEMTLVQLQQTPLVLRENGSGTLDVIRQALMRHSLHLNDMHLLMQLGSTESIKRFLEKTDAIGIVSIRSIDRELLSGTFKVIELPQLDMQRDFMIVQRQGQECKLEELFLHYLLEHK